MHSNMATGSNSREKGRSPSLPRRQKANSGSLETSRKLNSPVSLRKSPSGSTYGTIRQAEIPRALPPTPASNRDSFKVRTDTRNQPMRAVRSTGPLTSTIIKSGTDYDKYSPSAAGSAPIRPFSPIRRWGSIGKLDINSITDPKSHEIRRTRSLKRTSSVESILSLSESSKSIDPLPKTPDLLRNADAIVTVTRERERKASGSSQKARNSCGSDFHSWTPSYGSAGGLVGLRNLGNTCFMNSILQCLSHTRLLTEYFISRNFENSLNGKSHMKGRLVRAYATLLNEMWEGMDSHSAFSPSEFKSRIQKFAPRFAGYSQQDAQEFLRFLLDGLHDELNSVKNRKSPVSSRPDMTDEEKCDLALRNYFSRENSMIARLFVGQLKSTVECQTCFNKSITYDPFWDLSLPIPRKRQSSYPSSSAYGSSSYYSSSYSSRDRLGLNAFPTEQNLASCFKLFTKEETLEGENSPFCEKCNTKRKSTKCLKLARLPPILVIHLKRFGGFRYRTKISDDVHFPDKLDLKDYLDGENYFNRDLCLYHLYAVSNHVGSAFGGHYTASCKHYQTEQWFLFNDSSVSKISESSVQGSQCYVLFYEQCKYKK
eukprot:m.240850 g.240850  ORF g.240850 m.240850 type:complete len:598 (+) comp40197_c1_seq18:37-1830(+)